METDQLGHTCSMAELGGISDVTLSKLERFIREARENGNKAIIANLSTSQRERHGKTFETAGFRCVGKYYGNTNQYVYVYLYGVDRLTPLTKKRRS